MRPTPALTLVRQDSMRSSGIVNGGEGLTARRDVAARSVARGMRGVPDWPDLTPAEGPCPAVKRQ